MIKRSSPYEGILHEVVEHNGVLYLAGVVAEDVSADMEGQMRSIVAQIDQLLAAHGSSKDRILSATLYITDVAQKPALNKVWKEWLNAAHLPARAGIGVADLGPGVLVEVMVTAAK
ncbi:MAG: RidA family protein [Alphaproteobacteria bacterium]|nr:RidA family protein [Alphaproteobacteria bacterium]